MYRAWHLVVLVVVSISSALVIHRLFGHLTIDGPGAAPTVRASAALPLRFRNDGYFKILQVADMHFGMGAITSCKDVPQSEFAYCSDLNTTAFLRRAIKAEKPDFVVFTGDNIFGPSTYDAAESLFKAFRPVMESKLPWAAILGNHDQESTMTREELMSFISLMDYSMSQVNPSEIPPKRVVIDGFGNYNVKVYGPSGSALANTSILNLYFLDSGDRETVNGIRTYGWIKDSQLLWLSQTSKELQRFHQSPAMTFFHIPIPEVRDLWFREFKGKFQEGVACSRVNSGVLRSLVSMGDVKAVFIGHDHLNDFCGNLDGIHFCYGGGFGYHAYGRAGWHRRARVIVVESSKAGESWIGVDKIRTWKLLDDELLTRIDEQVLWEAT